MPEIRFPRQQMIAARLGGARLVDIRDRFGCSMHTAKKVCRGIPSPIDHVAEAARRNIALATCIHMQKAQARRDAGAAPPKRERRPAGVPWWAAHAGLTEDYRDLKAVFGEYYAARECRRLKAEALQ